MDPKLFRGLADQVYRHTGVTIEPSKAALLSGRIKRRVRALDLEDIEQYLELLGGLRAGSEELLVFIDTVTTHKTSFFRTASVWNYLKQEFLPGLEPGASVRAWSSASSSGQEAYSVAMLLDSSPQRLDWKVEGSDVSALIAERAADGHYDKDLVTAARTAMPSIPVHEYFDPPVEGERRVGNRIRSRTSFGQHNLLERRRAQYEIALCRNVLIYFSEEDKQRILDNVCATLAPGGLLIIGESESLIDRNCGLEYLAPCIYRNSN